MRGFFRVLPVRAGDDLPDQCRLRVFRAAVLLYVLYRLAAAQRSIVTYFTATPRRGTVLTYWDDKPWGKPFCLILWGLCFFLIIEIIERTEARQRRRLSRNIPFAEHREWGLIYLLPLAALAVLRLAQWLSVGMMLDWKVFPTQGEDVFFLLLSVPCIHEVRKLMNRQRAYAAAGDPEVASVALTTWMLAIPLLYHWISQFLEFLYFQMIGCGVLGVLINPLYAKYSTWINLNLSAMQYDMDWNPYLVLYPVLWAILMIAKAGKYGIGLNGTPPQNRMESGAAILLAFVYPSLPRWILLRPYLGISKPLSSGQRWLLAVFGACMAAILVDGVIVYIRDELRWVSMTSRPSPWWSNWSWHNFWYYDLWYFFRPIWILGALYEIVRASNGVEEADSRVVPMTNVK